MRELEGIVRVLENMETLALPSADTETESGYRSEVVTYVEVGSRRKKLGEVIALADGVSDTALRLDVPVRVELKCLV
jgi:hypothetical protein